MHNKKNFFIVLILIFLLVVIVGEITYYLYASNTKKPKINATSSVPVEKTNICRSGDQLPKIDTSVSDNLIKAATLPLNRAKPNKDQKLNLVFEQTGFAHIFTYDEDKQTYLMIVNEKGEKIFTLGSSYYKYLFKEINGQKIPITLSEVNEGDRIIDREIVDIYNNNTTIIEVLVYEQ